MRKLIVLALVAGCGIPKDTILTDITADQWDLICDRAVDTSATDRTVSCEGFDITIEATTVQDCVDLGATFGADGCTATLQDWIDCQEAPDLTDGQICGTEDYTPPAACVAMAACIGDGDMDTDTDMDTDSDSDSDTDTSM